MKRRYYLIVQSDSIKILFGTEIPNSREEQRTTSRTSIKK